MYFKKRCLKCYTVHPQIFLQSVSAMSKYLFIQKQISCLKVQRINLFWSMLIHVTYNQNFSQLLYQITNTSLISFMNYIVVKLIFECVLHLHGRKQCLCLIHKITPKNTPLQIVFIILLPTDKRCSLDFIFPQFLAHGLLTMRTSPLCCQ